MYSKVKLRKIAGSVPSQKDKDVREQLGKIFTEFERKRAPQMGSRSMSPYLLANSFNFDVN